MFGLVIVMSLFGADFPICTETNNQCYPCAIYANNQYYVFWSDWRFQGIDGTWAIFGTRVSSSGTVLDPGGKLLFKDTTDYEPSVACDGSNLLVVFLNNQ